MPKDRLPIELSATEAEILSIRSSTACVCHNVRSSLRPSLDQFVCPSVRLSGKGEHCDHTVHFSADLISRLDMVQCSGHPDTKACPPTPNCLFQFYLEERWDMDLQAR